MISFHGYEDIIAGVYRHKQEHVFAFWDQLSEREKKALLEDIATVDFELIGKLYQMTLREEGHEADFEPASYIALPGDEKSIERFKAARAAGEEHISLGKTAAFVVAGGQGSRLGYDGPKGMFSIGPVSGKSLFQIHAEKILRYSRKYGAAIPFLIMTSTANHEATVEFMRENGNFGINDKDIFIFPQNMIPSLDLNGRLILEEKGKIFKNPDGHGGSLTALKTSGVLSELEKRGIETISYFQVDNPLVRIIDPVFIGFHLMEGADISNKGLSKTGPEEKIGVFAKFRNGRMGVVEYSDLPENRASEKKPDGSLKFLMGSPAIHLFRRSFVEEITSGGSVELPFHVAKKKINSFSPEGTTEIEGYKFEKFVFDSLPLTDKAIVLEMAREEEFAPVKNPSGLDSVESAQRMMSDLFRKWIAERGIEVPVEVKVIEISPLRAVEAADLGVVTVPPEEKVYLE